MTVGGGQRVVSEAALASEGPPFDVAVLILQSAIPNAVAIPMRAARA